MCGCKNVPLIQQKLKQMQEEKQWLEHPFL